MVLLLSLASSLSRPVSESVRTVTVSGICWVVGHVPPLKLYGPSLEGITYLDKHVKHGGVSAAPRLRRSRGRAMFARHVLARSHTWPCRDLELMHVFVPQYFCACNNNAWLGIEFNNALSHVLVWLRLQPGQRRDKALSPFSPRRHGRLAASFFFREMPCPPTPWCMTVPWHGGATT